MPRRCHVPVARRRRPGRAVIATIASASEERSSSMARMGQGSCRSGQREDASKNWYFRDARVAYRSHRIPDRHGGHRPAGRRPDMPGSKAESWIDAQPRRRQEAVRRELRRLSWRGSEGYETGLPVSAPVYVSSHHSDVAFQSAAKNGVRAHHWRFGDMKPIPGVSADDVAHVTACVRWQQRLAGIE